jgi:hypothetical protein
MNKNKIEVGDLVRRIRDCHSGMKPGDTRVVRAIMSDGVNLEGDSSLSSSHSINNLELVSKKSSDLNNYSVC